MSPFYCLNAHTAADESSMMVTRNTCAAHHLHVSTSDIAEVKYEVRRRYGRYAVNGASTNGQTFQCSFNRKGTKVVGSTHTARRGCPSDISEADRFR